MARKNNGTFYSKAELAGTGEQKIIQSLPINDQTLIGVVQHKGESNGAVAANKADQGGQIFMFNLKLPSSSLIGSIEGLENASQLTSR